MRFLKLFESLEETMYQEIQSMIDANQSLKGKVKADESTVFEAGDFILLLSDLSHITDAHIDETIPGSKFNKGVDLKKAIVNLVSENEPTLMTKGFGPSESEVNDPEQAEKFKWLALDSKMEVGVENVHKLDPNSPEFKSINVYTYKDARGNEFKIKVKEGEGEKTTFLSFIGAKLGKIGDKYVLSVMTSFPGENGAEISNRNDFIKSGYYFTTTSKEVIENSTGSVAESKKELKHLKHHPLKDEFQNLSDDMKKQDHKKTQKPSNGKLDADKSLSDPKVSSKFTKPSNKKLDGENFLSDTKVKMNYTKPSNKKLDGENFLSEEVASTVKIHPIDNKSQKLAKTKKENHIKFGKKDKKLKPEKSLAEVEVPTKKAKRNDEPLKGEKSLSTDGGKIKKFNEL